MHNRFFGLLILLLFVSGNTLLTGVCCRAHISGTASEAKHCCQQAAEMIPGCCASKSSVETRNFCQCQKPDLALASTSLELEINSGDALFGIIPMIWDYKQFYATDKATYMCPGEPGKWFQTRPYYYQYCSLLI